MGTKCTAGVLNLQNPSPVNSPAWCKVVTALEAPNERETVAGKEPEGSRESVVSYLRPHYFFVGASTHLSIFLSNVYMCFTPLMKNFVPG